MKFYIKSLLLIAALAVSGCEATMPELLPDPHPVNGAAVQANVQVSRWDRWEPVHLYGAGIIGSLGLYAGIGHILTPMLHSYTNAYQNTCAQWSGRLAIATWVAAVASGVSITYLAPWSTNARERKYGWTGLIGSALVGTASATAFVYGINKRAL